MISRQAAEDRLVKSILSFRNIFEQQRAYRVNGKMPRKLQDRLNSIIHQAVALQEKSDVRE